MAHNSVNWRRSNASSFSLTALAEADVRTYISEPDRGRRRWQDKPEARQAVYGNRRRIQGEHGKEISANE